MAIRLRHPDSLEADGTSSPPGRAWLRWITQSTSLVYIAGGFFLIYQYWTHLHRQIALVTGMLFVIYGFYRFFLVRRSMRRR